MAWKIRKKAKRAPVPMSSAEEIAAMLAEPDYCPTCGREIKEFEQEDGETMTLGCPECDRE